MSGKRRDKVGEVLIPLDRLEVVPLWSKIVTVINSLMIYALSIENSRLDPESHKHYCLTLTSCSYTYPRLRWLRSDCFNCVYVVTNEISRVGVGTGAQGPSYSTDCRSPLLSSQTPAATGTAPAPVHKGFRK